MPTESVVGTDEHVRVAIASEVDEFEIGITPVEHRQRRKGDERFPAVVCGPLEDAWGGTRELDEIQLTVPSEIEQLLPSSPQGRERGLPGDQLHWSEARSVLPAHLHSGRARDSCCACRTSFRPAR